jgi:3-oxoacyl-[acyl-carrier protein] reductase
MSQPRNIIITGGNSGIGRAIAARFVGSGEHVAIIGRNSDTLRSTAESLGSDVIWQQADVSQREQVQAAVASIVEHWGQIDVLVNAAGFVRGVDTTMPLDEAEREWDAVIAANLKGSFLMAMAVAPHLTRPGGRIISISSIAAYSGGRRAGTIAYAASKAGLHGMTMGLARELSPEGITVNAIAPGFIGETGFTGMYTAESVNGIVAQTPVGRAGRAEDIAAAVGYLASPEASFVTGEVLQVNGGWLFGR